MKPGDVYKWLDQGPAILLKRVDILDPITIKELQEVYGDYDTFLKKDDWPKQKGWTIKLVETDEIVDVHDDTLEEITK